MASAGGKWPGPVTFNDDDPKRGYCTLFLSIPGLKVEKSLFGNNKPKNAKINSEPFKESLVQIDITVTNKDGGEVCYEYKKSLPEDIDPGKSSYEVKKEQIVLSLCKANKDSWAAHAKYLIKKE